MAVNRNMLIFHDKNVDESHPWKSPFLATIVGSIGQGKTNVMMNILDELNNFYNRIVVFSANKLDTKLAMLGEGVEVYGANVERLNEIITEIEKQQKKIKKAGKPLPPILLIFDDLISDKDFFPSTPKGNQLVNFIISLRHYNTSVIITAQQYKLIPKKLRVNTTMLFVFKLNEEDAKDIFKEANFGKSVFKKAYDMSTKDPHGFLYANFKTRSLCKGFGEELTDL